MKKFLCSLMILSSFMLTSCEEFISKGFDNETVKKLRNENTSLRIQIDKLQREITRQEEKQLLNEIIIDLYDLRHAVERFAVGNRGNYPTAENLSGLMEIVKPYLPKDFNMDNTYLETIKSSEKGYIFIVNVKGNKIVVSNLI